MWSEWAGFFQLSRSLKPRIKRSRESRIGGGNRCSRRHSSRNSKIVNSESRASAFVTSIADLSISTTAPRLDAIAASAFAVAEAQELALFTPVVRQVLA
jgi:hypothetical protein